MNLFKKIKNKETAVPASKSTLTLSILSTACVLVVLTVASTAYITQAWFATNRKVESADTSITSEAATTSLFISAGAGDVDNAYNMGYRMAWPDTAKLFPISSSTCANWWYASEFSPVWEGNTARAKASAYAAASVSETDGVATYNNSLDGDGKVAYLVSDYKLYTNTGTLNVFLSPENPITVTVDSGTKQLEKALRIGIMAGGDLKFIYAPYAETVVGNSSAAQTAGTFYAVSSATEIAEAANVVTSLSSYQAADSGDTDNPYTAGTTSLGTATDSGLAMRVFVWLEGTDGEAIVGQTGSDNDLRGIQIAVNYVGVLPS